jgi:tetratricopeptide (TPR) repeat protein
MKVRRVSFAFVSAAFLAAFATSCGTAYASSPEANTALVRKAYQTLQAGNAKAAVAEYSDAIASDMLQPEMLANALLNRALAHQQLKDHKAAVADYDAALHLNIMAAPLRATAHYNRGLSHHKLGNVTGAIENYTASLLINPEFAQAFYSRGQALRESGQLLFALSDFERALRFNHPDKARVHYGSATTYLALKRPLDAKREFNAALNINPDYGQARAQLVMLGDENAELAVDAADPILTGSVGAYAGGTMVRKPSAPTAVDVPTELQSAFGGSAKKAAVGKPVLVSTQKLDDRLPETEQAVVDAATHAAEKGEEVVGIEQVPSIPAPAGKKAKVEPKLAAVAQPQSEEITDSSPAQPAMTGWVVQIASADSENAAWSTWKKMQARHKVLKTKEPSVVKADLGAKGTFYRVRLSGFDDQTAAKQACSKLKAGGVACYISKVGG